MTVQESYEEQGGTMRTRKTAMAMLTVIILVASVLAACGGQAAEEPASEAPAGEAVALDGETLLEERCTECHGLDRTTGAEKTRDEWQDTVTRMVSKGANLNAEETQVLVDYLAETYGP